MKVGGWRARLGPLRGGGLRAHLLRGAGGNIAVAASARALALGSAVILARVLGPSGYGVFAFAVSVMGLLHVPAQLGMGPLLAREIAAGEATGRWDLVRGLLCRAAQMVSVATGLMAVGALLVLWLAPMHISREARLTLMLAVGLMVATAFGGVAAATLNGLRRVVIAQVPMQIGRPALFLAGVAGIWFLGGQRLDPLTAMAANVAAATAMLGVLLLLAATSFRERTGPAAPRFETRRWLASALPFAFMGGLGLINAQTDIVMLGAMTTSHDVGIYRVAVAGAGLIPLVLGAVNGAIGPTLAGLHSTGDRTRLARIVRLAALAGLAGGAGTLAVFAFWGHGLIRFVFGAAYALAWTPLMILSLGQAVNAGAGPVGVVLNMTGHERDAFMALAVAAMLNVALNVALIPSMSTTGAALATATSTVVWNVVMSWRVRARLGFLPFGVRFVSEVRRG